MKTWITSRSLGRRQPIFRTVPLVLLLGLLMSSALMFRPAAAHSQSPLNAGTVQTRALNGAPRLDTFVKGTDNYLRHRWWQQDTGWSNWESFDILMGSAPTAIVDTFQGAIQTYPDALKGNIIDVFYRGGPDLWVFQFNVCCQQTVITGHRNLGHLPAYVSPWPGGGFHTEGPLTSAPAVASWGPGRLDVFGFAGDHWLIHRWWEERVTGGINPTDDGWSDWELLSDADFSGDPAAVSWGGGRIDVFVHGSDGNALEDKVFDNGQWTNWQDLGIPPCCDSILYSPAAVSWTTGKQAVFAVGSTNQIWYR